MKLYVLPGKHRPLLNIIQLPATSSEPEVAPSSSPILPSRRHFVNNGWFQERTCLKFWLESLWRWLERYQLGERLVQPQCHTESTFATYGVPQNRPSTLWKHPFLYPRFKTLNNQAFLRKGVEGEKLSTDSAWSLSRGSFLVGIGRSLTSNGPDHFIPPVWAKILKHET